MSDERARKAAEEIRANACLLLHAMTNTELDLFELTVGEIISRHYPEPALSDLLEKARTHVMTPEEKEAQRQSWVRGEMGMGESAKLAPPAPMRETCSTTDSPPAAELAKWRETHPKMAAEPGAVARESQPKNPTDDVYALDKFWEWAEQNGVNGAVRIEHKQRVDEVAVAYAAHCLRQHREREERLRHAFDTLSTITSESFVELATLVGFECDAEAVEYDWDGLVAAIRKEVSDAGK